VPRYWPCWEAVEPEKSARRPEWRLNWSDSVVFVHMRWAEQEQERNECDRERGEGIKGDGDTTESWASSGVKALRPTVPSNSPGLRRDRMAAWLSRTPLKLVLGISISPSAMLGV